MKIFQYAVIYHPTEKEKEAGGKDELVVSLQSCLAPDINGATLVAGRAIPESYLSKLEQLEVAVRPF